MMNHLTESKAKGEQASFVKNYNEVAPPFNHNYGSFPKINLEESESKGFSESTLNSESAEQKFPPENDSAYSETSEPKVANQNPDVATESVDNKQKGVFKESNQKTVCVKHFTLKGCNQVFSEREVKLTDFNPNKIDKVWNVIESNVVNDGSKSVKSDFQKPILFKKGFVQTSTMDAEGTSVQSVTPEKFAELKLKEMLSIDQEDHMTVIPKKGYYNLRPAHNLDEARKRIADIEVMQAHGIPIKPKKFPNRSCFTCHEKGHVASCCPNKMKANRVSPAKSRVSVGSNEGPRNASPHKVSLNEYKNAYYKEYASRNPTSYVAKYVEKPRSISPRDRPNNGSPLRQKPNSNYYDRITSKVQSAHRPMFQQHSPRRFQSKSPERMPRVQPNSVGPSQRPESYKGKSISPNRRSSGFQSVKPSKAHLPRDGYWTDIKVKDENGRPKTIKAWVPYNN
jgi:hypothetical protein